MSANTKQILAITLGSLGLILGVLATVVAYNAKQATSDDAQVTAQVKQEFAVAQAAQDAKETAQVSKAEAFVNQLTNKEKKLLKSINANSSGIQKNKRIIRNLRNQINSLNARDKQLDSEISAIEADQTADYNKLNNRINNTNAQVSKLQKRVNNLSQEVDILAANP